MTADIENTELGCLGFLRSTADRFVAAVGAASAPRTSSSVGIHSSHPYSDSDMRTYQNDVIGCCWGIAMALAVAS